MHAVLVPMDKIQRDGRDIYGTNNTVVVGQQINLTNYISPNIPHSAITSYKWTIPGANNTTNDMAFYDYEPNANNSGYTNLFTPTNYTTNNYVNFYWSNGGANQVVTCTEVVYGQTNTISASFNVVRPQAGILVNQGVTQGQILADTDYRFSIIYGTPFLHFGTAITDSGMTFSQTNSVPTPFTGNFSWVQIITADSANYTTNTASYTLRKSGFDGPDFPYASTPATTDSPGSQLRTIDTKVTRNFNATMYLMWQADSSSVGGDKTVPVPLRGFPWNWSGTATNAPPTNNGTGWGVESRVYPTNTVDVNVTNEVQWTTNAAINVQTNTP